MDPTGVLRGFYHITCGCMRCAQLPAAHIIEKSDGDKLKEIHIKRQKDRHIISTGPQCGNECIATPDPHTSNSNTKLVVLSLDIIGTIEYK